jgi:GTP-binding protein
MTEQLIENFFGANTQQVENQNYRCGFIAIVGRPNVGKSTLTNALLGEERMITSPIAGTTVDSIDSIIEMGGIQATLIDTAGIRRKSKTDEGVEVLSVVQTKKALERCDVALLMIDGEEGVTDQDEKIGSLIEEVGCGVMLVVNKWDLHRHGKPGEKALKPEEAVEVVRNRMGYLKYAPILFVSAKKKTGLEDILPIAQQIHEERKVKITTHEFTEWVRKEATVHNPTNVKFYLCHQSGRHPPTFVFHCSQPDKIHFSLKRHFSNVIREKWGYMGSPLRLVFVKGKNNSR